MSIALEAKVEALEKRLSDLQSHLIDTNNHLLRANERIEVLEQTAARKPGPKPKDSNA